ncbi:MFS transporter [Pendulispora rubella]|uniref:MFS transporter n=1 Tax=Pendulispora rubella TaxID=2741070 RepID=A0ABZ2LHS1_9BACT
MASGLGDSQSTVPSSNFGARHSGPAPFWGLVNRSAITLGAILAAHTMLETARDTLFLEKVPLRHLPWMYLAIAALSALLVMVPRRGGSKSEAKPVWLGAGLGAAALGTAAFGLFATASARGFYYTLYLWSGLIGATAVTQFWSTMARLFTMGEAKRVYARINLGGILGGVSGAALARGLFLVAPARALLFLAAATFAGAGILSAFSATRASAAEAEAPASQLAVQPALVRDVFDNMYLRRIGAMALTATITLTLLDYVFKRALVARVPAESLGGTLASVALATNVCSAVGQSFLVPRIIRLHGAVGSLIVFPALLLTGAVAGTLGPVVAVAVAMRLVDGTLRFSLHRTAVELLFVPVKASLRTRAKTLVDVVTQRGGQALASVAILLLPPQIPLRILTAVLAVGSATWLYLVQRLRAPHVELFRAMVEEGSITTRVKLPPLDLTSVEVLVGALSSAEDNEVITAMEVLADRNKVPLIPTLILYHPNPRVVIRAFEIFIAANRRDAGTFAWRLVNHENADVRVRAVHAAAALAFDAEQVRAQLRDPDTGVRATAMVELWGRGLQNDEDIAWVGTLFAEGGDVRAQRAILTALATTRARPLLLAALPLAQCDDPEIKAAVARALETDPTPEALPALIAMLEHHRTREPARRALVAARTRALDALEAALESPSTPREVLVHVPRSISRFEPELAVPILLRILETHPDGMVRFKALRGLGRLTANGARVDVDLPRLMPLFERNLGQAHLALAWYESLMDATTSNALKAEHDLLATLLVEQVVHALERIFRLIGLTNPREDWEQVVAALKSKKARMHDSARELVENVVDEPLRGQLVPLLDAMRASVESRRPLIRVPIGETGLAALLDEMVRGSDLTVRSIAAHYAARLQAAQAS